MTKLLSGGTCRISQQEELDCISLWQENQDNEAIEKVLRSRARWVMTTIRNMGLPAHIDIESVFSDVMGEIFIALRGYNPEAGKVSTLIGLVVFRTAWRSSHLQSGEQSGVDINLIIDTDCGSAAPVIQAIVDMIEETPAEELNSTSRLLLRRMLSGRTDGEIASMMGWNLKRVAKNTASLRNYIAWRMVATGMSAAPWIDDRHLAGMAMEFEGKMSKLF